VSLLILFAKAPEPGRVKTRMVPFISERAASQLQKAFLLDTLQLTDSLLLRRAIACLPDPDHPFFLQCGKERPLLFFKQMGADLGERMKNAFEWGFSQGFQKVLLLGGDTPTLPAEWIKEAVDRLDAFPLVLGPSADGGYYLIGGRPPIPALFDGIAWGTNSVLAVTLQKVTHLQIGCHLLPFWYDIDRPEDLAFLKAHLALLKGQGNVAAKETRQVIEALEKRI
jgi:rSAM/selenodomain-associated transferase 1